VRSDYDVERRGSKNRRLVFLPHVEYQYVVASRTYTGTRIDRGVSSEFDEGETAALMKRYPLLRFPQAHAKVVS
jgi:hypothetical protein